MEFFLNFLVYLIAFLIGSLLAALAAKYLYPPTSEREAFAELDGSLKNGAAR